MWTAAYVNNQKKGENVLYKQFGATNSSYGTGQTLDPQRKCDFLSLWFFFCHTLFKMFQNAVFSLFVPSHKGQRQHKQLFSF